MTQKGFTMQKHLAIFTLLLSTSSISLAATLDAGTIKSVHEETKKAYLEKCVKDFQGATPALCECLAAKAESLLNDAELSKCNNDPSGNACISKAVSDAAIHASTRDSVDACQKQIPVAPATTAPSTTTTVPATTTPIAPTAPAIDQSAVPTAPAPAAEPVVPSKMEGAPSPVEPTTAPAPTTAQ